MSLLYFPLLLLRHFSFSLVNNKESKVKQLLRAAMDFLIAVQLQCCG